MILLRLLLLTLTAAGPIAAVANDDLDTAFDKDVIIIVSSRNACYRFDVYLALSFDQHRRGLMHVRNLPDSGGMLFVYDDLRVRSMWMKNTFIPLDMAFVRADGTIANIVRHTEPQSLKPVRSTEPVTYVLELNAGVTARLNIDQGSRLLWGPVYEK